MSTNLGFGKPPAQPKVSKRSTERADASKQYERMQGDGTPDYEVYIRIQGKKSWYPVGAIAVKRSSQINQAIFGSQEDLLQGAFRLYPILKKNRTQLEYGYRLKAFKDEPIQLAVPPQSSNSGGIQSAFTQLKDRFTSLLKRD
jgi:Family of unknown function (DUF6523)